MPEYLSPGVYVEEVDAGTKPIEGVSTSTAGFVGVTERGRVGRPELVTSFAQYLRRFGGHLRPDDYDGACYLSHALQGFFTNGGKRAYVVRVLPEAAETAALTLYDRGEGAGELAATLASRTQEGEGFVVLDDASGIAPGTVLLIDDGASAEYVEAGGAVVPLADPLAARLRHGDEVRLYTVAGGAPATTLDGAAAAGSDVLTLDSVAGIEPGRVLQVGEADEAELVEVQSVAGSDVTLAVPTADDHADGEAVRLVDASAPTTVAGEAAVGAHAVTVADGAAVAGADALGFGSPIALRRVAGGVLAVRLATPLARTAQAGDTVVVATLNAATNFALTADAAAGDLTVDVDDLTDIDAGVLLLVGDGSPEAEYVVVDAVDGAAGDPGTVTLRTPLRFPHAAGAATTVDDDTPGEGDAGFPPDGGVLARRAGPGDEVLVLGTAGGVGTGDVLRFGTAADAVEYRAITADDLDVMALVEPVASVHVEGLAVLGRTELLRLEAINPGAWGNSLRVIAEDDDPLLDTTVTDGGSTGDPTLQLGSGVGIEPGTVLEFYVRAGGTEAVLFRQKVSGRIGNMVSFAPAGLTDDVPAGTRVRTREFKLTVESVRINPRTQRQEVDAEMSETFRHLSLDPRHSRYAVTVIGAPGPAREGESGLVTVTDLGAGTAETTLRLGPDPLRQVVNGQSRPLGRMMHHGHDRIDTLAAADHVGVDSVNPDDRTGVQALKNIEDINIVAMPGRTSQVEQNALVDHCVEMRYRVAVLDSRRGDGLAEVQEHRNLHDTRYAALYYPWLGISDPFPRNPRAVGTVALPPSGHVIGIYARSDNTRGVHKAPANEVVRGITGIEVKLTKGEHDILNPRNINVIRDFRTQGRGIRVWGARVVTSDSDWRYLNVRRLFNFVEHSLDRGTQWVVFEPNDHRLWARLGQSVSGFLNLVWKDGALMGRTPEEAFFVKVDETTMTQDDIDAGRLILLIGIAPVKPAEFVIIRIGQWAGGSSVQEL